MSKQLPTARQPLAGLEVIELSNMITCSLAAQTMAAQGANIIKVEPPVGGDQMRPLGTQKAVSPGSSTTVIGANSHWPLISNLKPV